MQPGPNFGSPSFKLCRNLIQMLDLGLHVRLKLAPLALSRLFEFIQGRIQSLEEPLLLTSRIDLDFPNLKEIRDTRKPDPASGNWPSS